MAWTIRFDPRAERDLSRLDRFVQRRILEYLEKRVASSEHPEKLARPLSAPLSGLWRYRVENHRIVCRIHEEQVTVLVLIPGPRQEIPERGW